MDILRRPMLWGIVGLVISLVVGVVLFVTLPQEDVLVDSESSIDDTDYSETVYGAPEVDVDSFSLGEDDYFEYIVEGKMSVGKQDPTTNPYWYNVAIANPDVLLNAETQRELIKDVAENGPFTLEDVKECVVSGVCETEEELADGTTLKDYVVTEYLMMEDRGNDEELESAGEDADVAEKDESEESSEEESEEEGSEGEESEGDSEGDSSEEETEGSEEDKDNE